MTKKKYAIIDIETTGGRAGRDKITEIAIVIHDGEKVVDSFESLVNPECKIPYGITELTGISQSMVANAPKFYEIAKKVVEITTGTVFVAHNVRFDYGFVQEEFRRLGYAYTRSQLCTVRLSRKAFPGLSSYSLGNLIQYFGIQVKDRHRAMADVLATVELFERIMAKQQNKEAANSMVNLGIVESKLPKNLTIDFIHSLPESCGVYYMHDEAGKVVYVGKSVNIKTRIASHFTEKSTKSAKLQRLVHDITYELTGDELIALLLESNEIKRLLPPVNRAQRTRRFPYAVYYYYNDEGYLCFDHKKIMAKDRAKYHLLAEFPKAWSAKGHLEKMLEKYQLCGRLVGLNKGGTACFNAHIGKCLGACKGEEKWTTYNLRAQKALEDITTVFQKDFFIIGKGRSAAERSVVLVERGAYQGFGYLDDSENVTLDSMRDCIKSFQGSPETTRIIQRMLSKDANLKIVEIS